MMYTQLNAIKDLVKGLPSESKIFNLIDECKDELTKLQDTLKETNEELTELQDTLKETNEELTELQDKNEEERLPELAYLGLDTLYYRLENNNLKIQDQLDTWIEIIKKQNGVGTSYAR